MKNYILLSASVLSLALAGVSSASACVASGENVFECARSCAQSPTEVGVPLCMVGAA